MFYIAGSAMPRGGCVRCIAPTCATGAVASQQQSSVRSSESKTNEARVLYPLHTA